jgi:hypothetical protein
MEPPFCSHQKLDQCPPPHFPLTIIDSQRNLVGFARVDGAKRRESAYLKFMTYVGSRLLSQSVL